MGKDYIRKIARFLDKFTNAIVSRLFVLILIVIALGQTLKYFLRDISLPFPFPLLVIFVVLTLLIVFTLSEEFKGEVNERTFKRWATIKLKALFLYLISAAIGGGLLAIFLNFQFPEFHNIRIATLSMVAGIGCGVACLLYVREKSYKHPIKLTKQ